MENVQTEGFSEASPGPPIPASPSPAGCPARTPSCPFGQPVTAEGCEAGGGESTGVQAGLVAHLSRALRAPVPRPSPAPGSALFWVV